MRRNVFLPVSALACALAAIFPATAQQDKNGLLSLDTNGDGAIGRREALIAQINAYHRLDANGDDRISREELAASRPVPTNQPPGDDAERRQAEEANRRRFDRLDRDGDGGISLDEYQAAMTPYFDRLDGDGDGVIGAAELRDAYDSGAAARP